MLPSHQGVYLYTYNDTKTKFKLNKALIRGRDWVSKKE